MSLVLGCEPGPGLVCPPVVLVSRGHLNVVIELDNLDRRTLENSVQTLPSVSEDQRNTYFSILKFINRWPKTKFS